MGHIKNTVTSGGENIPPVEMEATPYFHAAIVQASIFGVPNERIGEELAAVVELAHVHTIPTDEELLRWVTKNFSHSKAPRYFWCTGSSQNGVHREWPKTASGELRNPDLRETGLIGKLVDSSSRQAHL